MKRIIALAGAVLIAASLFPKPVQAASSKQSNNTISSASDFYKSKSKAKSSTLNGIEMIQTPKSTCFSQIGYDAKTKTLQVTFRDSGKTYQYLKFPNKKWLEFKDQYSLGGWYNKNIKGKYECVKMF